MKIRAAVSVIVLLAFSSAWGKESLKTSMKKLRAAPQASEDESNVPEETTPILLEFKHQVRSLIEAELNLLPKNQPLDAKKMTGAVEAALKAQGAMPSEKKLWWECVQYVSVEKVKGRADLAAAIVTFQNHCDGDCAFYLYRKTGDSWRLVLADDGNGVSSGLVYTVAVEKSGNFYAALMTYYSNPGCMPIGVYGAFSILRPGPDPDHPTIVSNLPDSSSPMVIINHYYQCLDLESDGEGFTLKYHGLRFLGTSMANSRWHLERYQVAGDQATRTAPFALYPEDFLDEWSDFSWDRARLLCDSGKESLFKVLHEELGKMHAGAHIFLVQACPKNPGLWQVGVEEELEDKKKEAKKFYFMIAKKKGSFFIESGSYTPFPNCPGKDTLVNRYDEE